MRSLFINQQAKKISNRNRIQSSLILQAKWLHQMISFQARSQDNKDPNWLHNNNMCRAQLIKYIRLKKLTYLIFLWSLPHLLWLQGMPMLCRITIENKLTNLFLLSSHLSIIIIAESNRILLLRANPNKIPQRIRIILIKIFSLVENTLNLHILFRMDNSLSVRRSTSVTP